MARRGPSGSAIAIVAIVAVAGIAALAFSKKATTAPPPSGDITDGGTPSHPVLRGDTIESPAASRSPLDLADDVEPDYSSFPLE